MAFALVFPGQGSQSVGMMAAYGESAVIRETFAEASAALGEDLWAMVCDGPAERLALTVNTQPLMFDGGGCDLSRLAGSRRTEARTGGRPQSRRVFRLGRRRRAGLQRCRAAGAFPCPGDAGGRARR